MSLAHITAELLATAGRPFADAKAMPPSVYTSADFLAREVETMFRHEWICVGRASVLARSGDYLTYDLAGQPVVVVRNFDGQLHAFSNVCLHRMSTLVDGYGNRPSLTCPYHGWVYDLNGRLRGAPFMTKSPGFRKDDYILPAIRCEEWLGWIYITLDDDRPGVAEDLTALTDMIAPYRVEHYVECFRETHVWDTNWKVLAENFMESYHLPVCHAATLGDYSRFADMECPPGLAPFNYHRITKDAAQVIGNAHPNNTHLAGNWRKTTTLLAIYPSHLITLTPGYFWYLSLHPQGTDQVTLLFGGGLSPEFMADPEAERYVATLKDLLDAVNGEDRGCTERVFRGLKAGRARPGHLSSLERPLYDFMRYLAERTGDFDRTHTNGL